MEKIQLSFNCRTAGERVIERSTLVNIRTDSVDEATSLYQELMQSLGKGTVISEHEYLPQVPTREPVRLPAPDDRREPVGVNQSNNGEQPPLCPTCKITMTLRVVKKPGKYFNTQFYGCRNWVRNGCLERVPA